MAKKVFYIIISFLLLFTLLVHPVMADEEPPLLSSGQKGTCNRAVMIYMCGSDLESESGCATHNLEQILGSSFSANGNTRCIIMTGGAQSWQLDDDEDPYNDNGLLVFPEDAELPDDAVAEWDIWGLGDGEDSLNPKSKISNVYNQIWEAKGADAEENAGKLVLLDGDGVTGSEGEAVHSIDELMSMPETLQAFINYVYNNYEADKYDLILWDHGGGPLTGFAVDEHQMDDLEHLSMTYKEILTAIADNDLIHADRTFDFIDFDACAMASIELVLVLQGYTDYFIGSADTEPAEGQVYNGWLDMLGKDNDAKLETLDLGHKIVDDYVEYYECPDGGWKDEQNATLIVVDMNYMQEILFDMNLFCLLYAVNKEIRGGDEKDLLYYDETRVVENAIQYTNDTEYRDLFNIIEQIGVAVKEPKKSTDGNGLYTRYNKYLPYVSSLCDALYCFDTVYARGTDMVWTEPAIHAPDGFGIEYSPMGTGGLSVFFPSVRDASGTVAYCEQILDMMDCEYIRRGDTYNALGELLDIVKYYACLTEVGHAVMALTDRGVPKEEISYDTIKEYWTTEQVLVGYDPVTRQNITATLWDRSIASLMEACGGDDYDIRPWLERLTAQVAGDAVQKENVSADKQATENGTVCNVHIEKTDKRALDNAHMNMIAEFPAVVTYLTERYGGVATPESMYAESRLPIMTVAAVENTEGMNLDIQTMEIDEILDAYNAWYEKEESDWLFLEAENKVYALKDAEGNLHAVQVQFESEDVAKAYIKYQVYDPDEDEYYEEDGILVFRRDGYGEFFVSEFYPGTQANDRPFSTGGMEEAITGVKTVFHRNLNGMSYDLPITRNAFTITADNMHDIYLVLAAIDEVDDIADVDGDGEKLDCRYVIEDMFHHETDITDIIRNAQPEQEQSSGSGKDEKSTTPAETDQAKQEARPETGDETGFAMWFWIIVSAGLIIMITCIAMLIVHEKAIKK